jgi:putative FmdB family regulatory protein
VIRVFDYRCAQGHVHELFVSSEDHGPQPCKTCGQAAERQLSAPPFILEGHSGAFPGRASKWEREHEKAGRFPKQ